MQFFPALKITVSIAALCLCAQGQTAPAKESPVAESKGLPPRVTAAEYQAHAKVGDVTIAAEFKGHSVPTAESTLTSEDYVVVETGFFGADGARVKLNAEDFSLRVNGKKTYPAEPYGVVLSSLKDPEWEPPDPKKSKSALNTGGGQGQSNEAPAPVKMPFPLRRAMEQKVQKATLPEGDRALPVAGLIYFQYRGKTKGISSLELIYNGAAGKATLNLQP